MKFAFYFLLLIPAFAEAQIETDFAKLTQSYCDGETWRCKPTYTLHEGHFVKEDLMKHGVPSEVVDSPSKFEKLKQHLKKVESNTARISVELGVKRLQRYIPIIEECWNDSKESTPNESRSYSNGGPSCTTPIRECWGGIASTLDALLSKEALEGGKDNVWHKRAIRSEEKFFEGIDLTSYLQSSDVYLGTFGASPVVRAYRPFLGDTTFRSEFAEGINMVRLLQCNNYFCKIYIGPKEPEKKCFGN